MVDKTEQKYSRTEILIGEKNLIKIQNIKILILGLGGVGGICMEMLARAGVKNFVLVDKDKFEESNLNRQILSNQKNINKNKVDEAKKRLKSINKNIKIKTYKEFANSENIKKFTKKVDIVIDAIDSVKEKLHILKYLYENKIPVVSSMGAGFVSDISSIKIADISKTNGCRLAKYIRKNLKKYGIDKGIECIYSDQVNKPINKNRQTNIGSLPTITNTFGTFLAHTVIQKIINNKKQ